MKREHRLYRAMSDEAINSALYHLRAQIIREKAKGLKEVEALLMIRNCEVDAFQVPRKVSRKFQRGELRKLVLKALSNGPLSLRDVATQVHKARPDLDFEPLLPKIATVLSTVKGKGLAAHDHGKWSLIKV